MTKSISSMSMVIEITKIKWLLSFYKLIFGALEKEIDPIVTFNIFNVNPDPNEISSKNNLYGTQRKGNGIMQPLMTVLMGDMSIFWSNKDGIKMCEDIFIDFIIKTRWTWYDFQESRELTIRIATDIKNLQDGNGPKFGMIFQIFSIAITGYIPEFIKSCDLTLVLIVTVPLSYFFHRFSNGLNEI
ncbi:multidrug resistance protein, putative [Entamoeba dispar SAW760]|uniref:Multidrug resistance protein, putative n=1 Tax=Entamoeba dispar (strain ATCC PRA-260 / SAW760) TaxID=370354 RepID=B0EIP0_ENTDS|nr:multidrug resistance protein, putative [Entamoeba dispar SAW760]EDR25591.1 multidrug resistance protein, putative [Entamoeba dispar SAW760]|eukprot:EDR25591.1 multidrug resistance protein, putative [Entamoeba dispar SAW760]